MARKGRDRIILVPVDFSPVSKDVVIFACELAERLDRRLIILHVVHDPGEAPGYYRVKGHGKLFKRLEDVARDMFDKFLVEVRSKLPDNKVLRRSKTLLLTGLPVTRILEVVDRTQPWMDGHFPPAHRLEGRADRAPESRPGDRRQGPQAGVTRCVHR